MHHPTGLAWPDPWMDRAALAALFKGLVALACVSCVTSTIVAAPIKSQHFKYYESDDVYSRNHHDLKWRTLC